MQIGILGAPGAGKTTVFNVLAQASAEVGGYRAPSAEPNIAVVKVPDERLDRLTAIYHPKKTVPAEITYLDVGGIVKGAGREGSNAFPAPLRHPDMLLQGVRAFDHTGKGTPNERQLQQLELALFERLAEGLRAEQPVRDLELSDADRRLMKSYALLTAKPLLIVVNVNEPGPE